MKSIVISPKAIEDISFWKQQNKSILLKITSLIVEISATPFAGTGKPEPLKHTLKGKWSCRLTEEHRLVYEVNDKEIIIISCKYHHQ